MDELTCPSKEVWRNIPTNPPGFLKGTIGKPRAVRLLDKADAFQISAGIALGREYPGGSLDRIVGRESGLIKGLHKAHWFGTIHNMLASLIIEESQQNKQHSAHKQKP